MPFRFGPMEIALVLVIILIVFGVGKLPQIGGAIGKSMREFRRTQQGEGESKPELEASKASAAVKKDAAAS